MLMHYRKENNIPIDYTKFKIKLLDTFINELV